MGLSGINLTQVLVILLIVILVFGTKKLRGMGSDLGGAIKGFKKAMNDENDKSQEKDATFEEPSKLTDSEKSTASKQSAEDNHKDRA